MNEKEKPIGDSADFSHLTPFEREKREAARRAGIEADPEAAFREEMRVETERKNRAEIERKKFLAGETDVTGQPKPPSKTFHLLVGKINEQFHVVGMYSDREKLAAALADSVMVYASAGVKLGVVEFNLGVKLDQPPTPPA